MNKAQFDEIFKPERRIINKMGEVIEELEERMGKSKEKSNVSINFICPLLIVVFIFSFFVYQIYLL